MNVLHLTTTRVQWQTGKPISSPRMWREHCRFVLQKVHAMDQAARESSRHDLVAMMQRRERARRRVRPRPAQRQDPRGACAWFSIAFFGETSVADSLTLRCACDACAGIRARTGRL